jgi:Uma2 family endonuclease
MATATETDTTVDYPTSDGQPVAESDKHIDLLTGTRLLLKGWADERTDVYAAGNMLVYYQEGNAQKVLAPDGFVVFGVPSHDREIFKTWEEGATPAVVFEFTSKTTKNEDLGRKLEIYRDVWKVKEYFLFDPYEEYLDPPLQGYRLTRKEFKPIRRVKGRMPSKELGLTLERDGTELILRDAKTGKRLQTAEGKRTTAERDARLRAEAEIDRLKAELDALRKAK